MPRKKQLNRKRYREQKKVYHSLRLEEKIHALRERRKERVANRYSEAEKVLLSEVAAIERMERIEALELKLMNFERKQVGLPPYTEMPLDPRVAETASDLERRRRHDAGRIKAG